MFEQSLNQILFFYSIIGQKTKAGNLNFSYNWLSLNFDG